MAYYYVMLTTVSLSLVACANALICYNCTGVTHMDACQNKITCGENEVCFKQRKYSGHVLHELGCIDRKKCGEYASLNTSISRMDNVNGQTQPCYECCSRDTCNINLCQSKDLDVCVDDKSMDCAFLNSLFKLCKDVNQARKICPNYCNLCQVVDGNWTPWSNWSDCDVTCDDGTQIRTRSCTDPAPQYGGLDCWGNDTETKSCHRDPCPIHGGWKTWSTWSECSVSCDIGMQHRDRSCTNPRPSLFGDHCFGSDEQYRICTAGACADGGWTDWGNWGTCSKTCAGGVISRNRTCSNPAPSILGKQCVGNFEQVSVCNVQACQDRNVAFTAYNVLGNTSAPTVMLFQNTYLNYGNGYDVTTGRFTCNVSGMYHFVVALSKVHHSHNLVYALLRVNGSDKVQLFFYMNGLGSSMMTSAAIFHLNRNDFVDVYGIPKYFYHSLNSVFTGFLIFPDQ